MGKNQEELASGKFSEANEVRCCGLPIVPIRDLDPALSANRASLIRQIEKKWVNHTVLHFLFLETNPAWAGAEAQKQVVRDSFQEWKDLGIGLSFVEVDQSADAEIRIGFEPGGSWSYVGRDNIDFVSDPNLRTMNFGWDLTTAYGHDTALHEIGHALAFSHEHQNPKAGIVWDEEAVYDYFGGPPNNWDRGTTKRNIIRKISPTAVEGSKWDKDSIMHYQFRAGLIVTPERYQKENLIPDPGLSEADIEEVRKFYPDDNQQELSELEPFLSQLVNIGPGEQMDFMITPNLSRKYAMQTFGNIDVVMVLFEDVNGQSVYLSGDDDSGMEFNARIEHRLIRGRKYYLRLRLYHAEAEGHGAVMLW